MFTPVSKESVRETPLCYIPGSSITRHTVITDGLHKSCHFTQSHWQSLWVLHVDIPLAQLPQFCESITCKVMPLGCSLHGSCFEQLWALPHRCHLGKCGVTWYFLNILPLFTMFSNIHMPSLYLSFIISTHNKFSLKIVNVTTNFIMHMP